MTENQAYRASVRASGDDVGNLGHVEVASRRDGSVALGVRHRDRISTVWLTYAETIALTTALLLAVERPPASDDERAR